MIMVVCSRSDHLQQDSLPTSSYVACIFLDFDSSWHVRSAKKGYVVYMPVSLLLICGRSETQILANTSAWIRGRIPAAQHSDMWHAEFIQAVACRIYTSCEAHLHQMRVPPFPWLDSVHRSVSSLAGLPAPPKPHLPRLALVLLFPYLWNIASQP